MARLIVEVGGTTRRFKLGDGKLTLGSGQGATLTLDSASLAEVHAEIEVAGGKAVLRTRKGTTAPSVRGRSVQGDVQLAPGLPVRLGDVTLTLDGAQAAAAPGARAAGQRTAPAGVAAGRPRARAREEGGERPRARRQPSQSLPSWLIVLLVLAVVGVSFLLWRGQTEKALNEEAFAANASRVRIESRLSERDFLGAGAELEKVDRHWDELDASWRAIFDGFRPEIEAFKREAELLSRNSKGTEYWQKQLKGYIEDYLKDSGRPQARVLLKRIAWFRSQYPLHPQLGWCERMEERWAPVAQMADPDTFDDMAWEVKTLTWAMPRDYKQAFQIIDGFLGRADAGDRRATEDLVARLEGERRDYFADRLQQANLYERKQEDKAVFWLVQIIIKIDDESMADQAAQILVDIPGVDSPLRGYHNYDPDVFTALMRNPIVRRFVEEQDVLRQGS